MAKVSIRPTVSLSAYHANDCVGGLIHVAAGVQRNDQEILQSIHIADLANQKAGLVLVFFDAEPSAGTYTDHAAIDFSDDAEKIIRSVLVNTSDYQTVGGIALADINIAQTLYQDVKDLHLAIMCTGTPTFTGASDLKIELGLVP